MSIDRAPPAPSDSPVHTDVAVLIPTLRRPAELARALASLARQQGVRSAWEIVVVDNAPEGCCRGVVEAARGTSPAPIAYVHEPRPGVATARNAGLSATRARLIAFLDDDQEASPGWLAALLSAQAQLGADVVFGPIQGVATEAPGWLAAHLEQFFSREREGPSPLIQESFGCGNALFLRGRALPGRSPFNPSADQTGGEDDAVFAALRRGGGAFGWAADARVIEHAPHHRSTLAYALRRAFRFGQAPTQTAARAGDWAGVMRWMLIGAGQAVVYGLAAAALFCTGRPRSLFFLDRSVRGMGKLFWMRWLEPRFYGEAEVRRSAARASDAGAWSSRDLAVQRT